MRDPGNEVGKNAPLASDIINVRKKNGNAKRFKRKTRATKSSLFEENGRKELPSRAARESK